MIEQLFFHGVRVKPGDGAQPPGDGGPSPAAGFQIAGEELDAGPVGTEQVQLAGVSVWSMQQATGLSAVACWRIKRDERRAHPRYQEALQALADVIMVNR